LSRFKLGLAGAAQIGCLHRQSGKDAELEIEHIVTSRPAKDLPPEAFLQTDRQYWASKMVCTSGWIVRALRTGCASSTRE